MLERCKGRIAPSNFKLRGRWIWPGPASEIEKRTASLKPSSWLTPSICAKLAAQSKLLSYLGQGSSKTRAPQNPLICTPSSKTNAFLCNNELLPISGQPTHMSSMMCSATTEASKILLPSWRVYESKSAPMIGWSTLNTAKTLSLLIFYIFLKCVPSYSDIATMMVGVGIANRGLQVGRTHPLNFTPLICQPLIISEWAVTCTLLFSEFSVYTW